MEISLPTKEDGRARRAGLAHVAAYYAAFVFLFFYKPIHSLCLLDFPDVAMSARLCRTFVARSLCPSFPATWKCYETKSSLRASSVANLGTAL